MSRNRLASASGAGRQLEVTGPTDVTAPFGKLEATSLEIVMRRFVGWFFIAHAIGHAYVGTWALNQRTTWLGLLRGRSP